MDTSPPQRGHNSTLLEFSITLLEDSMIEQQSCSAWSFFSKKKAIPWEQQQHGWEIAVLNYFSKSAIFGARIHQRLPYKSLKLTILMKIDVWERGMTYLSSTWKLDLVAFPHNDDCWRPIDDLSINALFLFLPVSHTRQKREHIQKVAKPADRAWTKKINRDGCC